MPSYGRSVRAQNARYRKVPRDIRWQLLYGMLLLIAITFLCYAVWYVTRLPFFTIDHIEVVGGETISHEAVRAAALSALSENYFLLVPKRFAYLYPREAVRTLVLRDPHIQSAEVARTDRNTLLITLTEQMPYGLWCGSGTDVQKSCVYINAEGYAFAEAPSLEGSVFVRHITPERTPEVGIQLFGGEDMARMGSFIAALNEQLLFRVKHVTHTLVGDEEYALFGGGMLQVSPTQSATTTFDNLYSILEAEEFKDLRPGNFNYVDLRFGNRIFVKKESDTPVGATTTEEEAPLPEPE